MAADAISREFNVPNGPEMLAQVTTSAPRAPLIGQLWASFSSVLNTPFPSSIGDRSRRTYGVGVRHWEEFRAANLVSELGSGDDDEGNVAAFLAYLVTVVGVAPQTADSYLSHVLKRAVASRTLESTEHIRTLYNRGVIRGLKWSYD